MAPAWTNTGASAAPLTGTAAAFTGPSGAAYTIGDLRPRYGSIPAGHARLLRRDGRLRPPDPSTPAAPAPSLGRDLPGDPLGGPAKTWMLHVGDSFIDVPRSQPFYRKIETLLHSGITSGCGGSRTARRPVPRSQMAIFLASGIAGSGAAVPAGGTLGDPRTSAVRAASRSFPTSLPPTPSASTCTSSPRRTSRRDAALPVLPGGERHPRGNGCVSRTGDPRPGRRRLGSHRLRSGPGHRPLLQLQPASPSIHFTDVPAGDPFCRGVHYLWAKGIVAGCSATTILPVPGRHARADGEIPLERLRDVPLRSVTVAFACEGSAPVGRTGARLAGMPARPRA